jgi:O-antigen/teichoic acid export membrane protein
VRECYSFGLTTMLGRGASLARTEVDRLILLYFGDPLGVAGYNVAARGARQLNVFNTAYAQAIAPSLVRNDTSSAEKLDRSRRQTDIVFWGAGPLILIAILMSPLLLRAFGAEYVVFSYVFATLAILEYLHVAFGPVEIHLRMLGLHRSEAVLMALSSALLICTAIVMAPTWGVMGVTIAAVVGAVSFKVLALIAAQRGNVMLVPMSRILRLFPALAAVASVLAALPVVASIGITVGALMPVAIYERAAVAEVLRRARLTSYAAAGRLQ